MNDVLRIAHLRIAHQGAILRWAILTFTISFICRAFSFFYYLEHFPEAFIWGKQREGNTSYRATHRGWVKIYQITLQEQREIQHLVNMSLSPSKYFLYFFCQQYIYGDKIIIIGWSIIVESVSSFFSGLHHVLLLSWSWGRGIHIIPWFIFK